MYQGHRIGRSVTLAGFTAVGALLCGFSAAQAQYTPPDTQTAQAQTAQAQTAQAQTAQATTPGVGGSGSFPGSFLVPGTNTSLKIGGYAKVDYQYDMGTAQNFNANGQGSATLISAIPLDDNIPGSAVNPQHSIHGDSRITAAESRINVETRTPTGYGELKVFIEADFEGTSGVTPGNTFEFNSDRTAFALRHAYGTLGPLLAGQYFSLFEDIAAAPETLDFDGAIGVAGPLRQPQIRYVYNAGNGLTFAASVENPQTSIISTTVNNVNNEFGTSTFGLLQGEKVPDLVGAIIWAQGPAHLAFRGVLRDLYDHGTGNTTTPVAGLTTPMNASTVGWGLGLSGDLHVLGPDDIIFQINGGDGIGRYVTDSANSPGDSVISADGHTLKAVPQWGGILAYQHWWTDKLRSNVEGSVIKTSYPTELFTTTVAGANPAAPLGALGSLNSRLISSHANLIWSPVPPVDLGVEYIWEERRTVAGQIGHIDRLQASAKFKF
jgi:hypothetical protein